jgi:hypothetical protein
MITCTLPPPERDARWRVIIARALRHRSASLPENNLKSVSDLWVL